MVIDELFSVPLFADGQLRYVIPRSVSNLAMFKNYGKATDLLRCQYQIAIPNGTVIEDFETEGCWICKQSFHRSFKLFSKNTPEIKSMVLFFESLGERALFRLMLP